APLSSISLVFAMKSVLADAGLHIVAPEPDRATTSEGWIARREDNLFVTAHTQDFVRQDQGPSAELLRPRSRRSPHSRRAICVIDLDCGIAAAPRDVVSCLRIIDRRERYPRCGFEPFASRVVPAISLTHLSDRLEDHGERDAVFPARVARRFENAQIAEAGDFIEEEECASFHIAIAVIDRIEQ